MDEVGDPPQDGVVVLILLPVYYAIEECLVIYKLSHFGRPIFRLNRQTRRRVQTEHSEGALVTQQESTPGNWHRHFTEIRDGIQVSRDVAILVLAQVFRHRRRSEYVSTGAAIRWRDKGGGSLERR